MESAGPAVWWPHSASEGNLSQWVAMSRNESQWVAMSRNEVSHLDRMSVGNALEHYWRTPHTVWRRLGSCPQMFLYFVSLLHCNQGEGYIVLNLTPQHFGRSLGLTLVVKLGPWSYWAAFPFLPRWRLCRWCSRARVWTYPVCLSHNDIQFVWRTLTFRQTEHIYPVCLTLNNMQIDRNDIALKSTCENFRLESSVWLVLLVCVSGAPCIGAPLNGGGYTIPEPWLDGLSCMYNNSSA